MASERRAQRGDGPLTLFYSYAHEDEAHRDALAKHLTLLQRQGYIRPWHDRRISPGNKWDKEIDENLKSADIVLLLISADFIHSEYCYGVEMGEAIRRHEAGEARVIPVILRDVDMEGAPFSAFQALPKDARAIESWPSKDRAYKDVASGVRRVAEELAPGLRRSVGTRGARSLIGPHRVPTGRRTVATAAAFVTIIGAAVALDYHQSSVAVQAALADMDVGEYHRAGTRFEAAMQDSRVPWPWPAIDSGLDKTVRLEQLRTDGASKDADVARRLLVLLEEAPQDPHVHIIFGEFYLDTGDHEQAIVSLKSALELRDNTPQAHFNLGIAHEFRGELNEAIEAYETAIEQAPHQAEYRINLAHAYQRSGKEQEAFATLAPAQQGDLIIAYMELARLLLDGARPALNKALVAQKAGARLLFDDDVAMLPKNQQSWYFEISTRKIYIDSLSQRRCYAQLTLRSIYWLLGDTETAGQTKVDSCTQGDPGGKYESWVNTAEAATQARMLESE